ncbi:hypothetical protein [Candidatus Magnetaquicoccus inordinatus]|uniref:hypothetical protein n=1 Tax=Candidatus Magnetaquicoccus inordinatus TaxID=2496818 RepID=UPI00102CC9E7|nr:hypothetical protein [Candidatus Magnetaquicoccus inordinatus]
MKILSILLVVFVFFSGCASHGVIIDDKQLTQFKRGVTTETDVIAALGKPTGITTHNGQRMLSYGGAHAQSRPESFIPIVGSFVGGMDVRASSVIFNFGPDGVLSDIISSQHSSGSGFGFAAGTPLTPDREQPRKPAE